MLCMRTLRPLCGDGFHLLKSPWVASPFLGVFLLASCSSPPRSVISFPFTPGDLPVSFPPLLQPRPMESVECATVPPPRPFRTCWFPPSPRYVVERRGIWGGRWSIPTTEAQRAVGQSRLGCCVVQLVRSEPRTGIFLILLLLRSSTPASEVCPDDRWCPPAWCPPSRSS